MRLRSSYNRKARGTRRSSTLRRVGRTHEVDPDRANVTVRILVLLLRATAAPHLHSLDTVRVPDQGMEGGSAHRKPREQARLADARVTNQHQLEQVVVRYHARPCTVALTGTVSSAMASLTLGAAVLARATARCVSPRTTHTAGLE